MINVTSQIRRKLIKDGPNVLLLGIILHPLTSIGTPYSTMTLKHLLLKQELKLSIYSGTLHTISMDRLKADLYLQDAYDSL